MKKTIHKSIRINLDTYQHLKARAEKENRSFNNMLETALMGYIGGASKRSDNL